MNEAYFLNSSLFEEARLQIKATMDLATQQHLDIFGQTWYDKHFTHSEFPRSVNEFTAILEEVHAAPAASTINEYSERPIRSLDGFGKIKAEMLTVAHTYKLEDEDLAGISNAQRLYKGQQLLDYVVNKLMNVRSKAIQGIRNRQDMLILTLLSNDGKYTFTNENDPGSPYIGQTLDFGFDATHAASANTPWTEANKSTVNVLEDIMSIYQSATIKPTKMLMEPERLFYILSTDKAKLYVNGSDRASRPISKTDLDNLLAQYGLPAIELVQREIRIDANGGKTVSMVDPWKKGQILFVPEDNFGTIERKLTAAEDGRPSPGVEYAYYNGIEVANWTQGLRENTNYTEFVSAALTSTPVVENIRNMYSLDTKA